MILDMYQLDDLAQQVWQFRQAAARVGFDPERKIETQLNRPELGAAVAATGQHMAEDVERWLITADKA